MEISHEKGDITAAWAPTMPQLPQTGQSILAEQNPPNVTVSLL